MRASDRPQISDVLVLAALARAQCHRGGRPAPWWVILEHLGATPRSATARQVQIQLDRLVDAAALRSSRRHGRVVWNLTDDGRRRLARAGEKGQRPSLPEAPQHREWRLARARAAEEMNRLRAQLEDTLGQAQGLLQSSTSSSQEWKSLAGRLQQACSELGAAVYCSNEWPEPDESNCQMLWMTV